MKKIFRVILCVFLFSYADVNLLKAQNTISYSDSFVVDVTYGSGQPQWDNWSSFRTSLDTTKHSFLSVTMKGTFDKVGHTCNDPKLAKQIAHLLKNNATYSVTCNGIVWKAGTVGNGVEFSSDGTLNKCAKKGGYTLRPQMGSSRWGGINTGSCGNISQRMEVIFEKVSKPQDAGISKIHTSVCSPKISVYINNFGNTTIDSLKICWSVNNSHQKTLAYSKLINALSRVNMELSPNYAFKDGETYMIKAWTCHPFKKDSVSSNDSSIISFQYIAPPGLPQTNEVITCGINKVWLKASANSLTDSLNWYTKAIGGNHIGTGKNIISPNLILGANSFYVESSTVLKSGSKCVNPERVVLKVTANPRPYGASIINSNNYNTVTNHSGNLTNPDIMTTNDEIVYEITPPMGYTNSDFNTKWRIDTLIFKTKSGRKISETYYSLIHPKGNENAVIIFKTDSLFVDSLLGLNLTIATLGKNACDSSLVRNIYIAPRPKPFFSFSLKRCETDTVSFTNLSKILSGNMTYKWNFNTGRPEDTSNLTHPFFKFPGAGIYHVELIATSVPYGYSSTITIPVLINENPKINYKVRNACMGDSLMFYNTTILNNGTLSYEWDFGDGMTSHEINPQHLYKLNGRYKVLLTAKSNNGCEVKLTKNAHQFERPFADFEVIGSCSQSEIRFINTTTIKPGNSFGSYWELEESKTTNEYNPNHIFTTSGIKTIKYKATSQFGCTDSIIKSITILPTPVASFTDEIVCNKKPVTFRNTSLEPLGGNTKYIWDFGNGVFSESKYPAPIVYNETGLYLVILKAYSENGCNSLIEKNITVQPQLVANFEVLDVCAGDDMVFTNKTKGSGSINYEWDFGDGTKSIDFNPVKGFNNKPGTYNVKLIAKTMGGCDDQITLPASVNEKPTCKFSFKSLGNGGVDYIFTPEGYSNSFYQWSFEGGGTSNAMSPIHKFEANGRYRVRVLMKNASGCDCVDSSVIVNVNALGNKDFKLNSGISFYPNPNNGGFTINLATLSAKEHVVVRIIDLNGKVLITESLVGGTNHWLQYNQLANGFYGIEMARENGERSFGRLSIIN